MKKVKLNILGLSFSQTQDGAYVLILIEEEGERRIPIIIGGTEAQAIAIQLENLKAPRPLTHDLFLSFAKSYEIEVTEVIIYKLQEGIFYSKIMCKGGEKEIELDSRTSDAVALAIRFGCSIYTTSDVLAKAGIIIELDKDEDKTHSHVQSQKPNDFESYSDDELQQMLDTAIEDELYERASLIRDEIKKRNA